MFEAFGMGASDGNVPIAAFAASAVIVTVTDIVVGAQVARAGRSSPRFREFVAQLLTSASHVFGTGLNRRRPCRRRGVRPRLPI